ncbi:MAG: hypothetical protein MI747_21870 [Desulfobacterales bacterium]|nr:hypothetical protein [Desulfobacterales bacterium]
MAEKKVFGSATCSWCEEGSVDSVVFLPKNSIITQGIFPESPAFLSSLIWIRAKYYFGSRSSSDQAFDQLMLLMDQITDLAPRWHSPYLWGGILLYSEAGEPEESLFLIKKGIRNFPDSWELLFLKGFIEWKYFAQLDMASESFFQASLHGGAPIYLPSLAATLAQKNGDLKQALNYLQLTLERILPPTQREIVISKVQELANP